MLGSVAETAPKTLAPEQDEMDTFEFFCVSPLGDNELYLGQFYVKFHEEHDALLEFDITPTPNGVMLKSVAKTAPKTLAPEQDEMDTFEFFCVSPLGDNELYLGKFYVKFHEEHDTLLEFDITPTPNGVMLKSVAKTAPKTLAPEQDEMDAFEFFCVSPLGDKELYLGQFYVKFHEEHDALLAFDITPTPNGVMLKSVAETAPKTLAPEQDEMDAFEFFCISPL